MTRPEGTDVAWFDSFFHRDNHLARLGFHPLRSMRYQLNSMGKQAVVSIVTAATLASTIKSLVGHVNSVAVGSYAIGELMLTSFRGQQRDDETFDLNLGWSYIPNVSSETWGDVTGVSYKGHEYAWAYTKDAVDRNGNALYQVPQFVYVNQVWPTGNLNTIGIYPP